MAECSYAKCNKASNSEKRDVYYLFQNVRFGREHQQEQNAIAYPKYQKIIILVF